MTPSNPWFWVLFVLFSTHGVRHWRMMVGKKSRPSILLLAGLGGLFILSGTEKAHPGIIALGLVALAVIDHTIPGLWQRMPIPERMPNQTKSVADDPSATQDDLRGSRISSGYGELLFSAIALLAHRRTGADGGTRYLFPFPRECPRCNSPASESDSVLLTVSVPSDHQVLNGPAELSVAVPYCAECQKTGIGVSSYVTVDIPSTGFGVVVSCGKRDFFRRMVSAAKDDTKRLSDSEIAECLRLHVRSQFIHRFGMDGLVRHTKTELAQQRVEENW